MTEAELIQLNETSVGIAYYPEALAAGLAPTPLTPDAAERAVRRLETRLDPAALDVLAETVLAARWRDGEERSRAQALLIRLHLAKERGRPLSGG